VIFDAIYKTTQKDWPFVIEPIKSNKLDQKSIRKYQERISKNYNKQKKVFLHKVEVEKSVNYEQNMTPKSSRKSIGSSLFKKKVELQYVGVIRTAPLPRTAKICTIASLKDITSMFDLIFQFFNF
jgi:hypothetical protein